MSKQEINGQRETELPVCKGVEDSVKVAKALIATDPELERFATELCNNDAFFSDQLAKMLETASQLGCENLVPISGPTQAGQPVSASSSSGNNLSQLKWLPWNVYFSFWGEGRPGEKKNIKDQVTAVYGHYCHFTIESGFTNGSGGLQKTQDFIASHKGYAAILIGAMAVSAVATYYWRRKRLRKLLQ